jgi:outer membrane protein assembly factor BamD
LAIRLKPILGMMNGKRNRWHAPWAPSACLLAAASLLFLPACGLVRPRGPDLADIGPGDQPDKILYERAMGEISRGRFDVGRLTFQTMLNTYPDSEYLAKAKLAIADSYYTQGGVSGLTQSEAEYKDFITFFPTAPEAPEAQFRAGMAHFKLMGKADRDLTETRLADAEFKEFLLKYPDSPTMPRVKGRLRQVQEVLAQGEFNVAKFYFEKGANRAAKSRFEEIANDYPNFSGADSALWYLGQTLERLKTPNEAVPYYARIVTDYPLSPLVSDAKGRLTAMHQPVPRPTKATLARAEADAFDRRQNRRGILDKLTGVVASSPDLSATRHGPVQLGPRPPGGTVMASGAEGAGVPGNSISVQPVGEEGLKAGKSVYTKPTENGDASGNPAASGDTSKTKTEGNPPDPGSSPKKKGRFHFLKKVVKPF